MSAATTTTTQVARSRTRLALSDWWVLTKRNLLTYIRKPDLLVFSTIQPVMFVLLFVYVFGGAFEMILPPNVTYVDFLIPGIIVQTSIFAALQTGVGLADDLQKGLIERFKSLPMARSAVLAGRTAADTVSVVFQIVLMVIVGVLIGYRLHEGITEAVLAFVLIVAVGYTFTWVAAFAGLALKSVEAVQAATFTIVFPVIFVSSAFVPVDSMPGWIQPIARNNPMTIWVDTVRSLTLGDPFTDSRSPLFQSIPDLGALAWQSLAWIAVILAIAVPVGVRMYRRT
ncbi:MAG TPA: ABC transporter permease [Actinomycetota bacterium]|jgi:ABC-2 type transport system permease protein/oleandomycin transport system permease protein|nr:ABC transporter permease [Actinomycetota bacterium]